jgi:bacterioferritin (cytochrome b1)
MCFNEIFFTEIVSHGQYKKRLMIKECSGFTALVQSIADGNDRKHEFVSYFGSSQETMRFNEIFFTELVSHGQYKNKALIISEIHFKALFGKDFEDLEHEDERKKVLENLHFLE